MMESASLIKEIEAYKAMAADTERENEAHEWCNAYFGPAVAK